MDDIEAAAAEELETDTDPVDDAVEFEEVEAAVGSVVKPVGPACRACSSYRG